jgi:hypothetical protein
MTIGLSGGVVGGLGLNEGFGTRSMVRGKTSFYYWLNKGFFHKFLLTNNYPFMGFLKH